MWFRTLSFVIAAALLGKAAIALAIPRRFYAVRERQYASESLPPKLLVAPVVVVALTLVAWYATIFHYQPWSWVVTGFAKGCSRWSGSRWSWGFLASADGSNCWLG